MNRPTLCLLAVGLLALPFLAATLAPLAPPAAFREFPELDPPPPPAETPALEPVFPVPPEPVEDGADDEPVEAPVPADPFEAVASIVLGNVAMDPVLRDFDLLALRREPWLVFVERSAGEERAAEIGGKVADLLDALHREVLARLGEELGLRPLREIEDADMRVLRVLVFTSEKAADRYDRLTLLPRAPGSVAEYLGRDRWLEVFIDERGLTPFATFSVPCMGFHQLMHVWRKAGIEGALGADLPWTDPRVHPHLLALEDGMAGLFAGFSQEPAGGAGPSVPGTEGLEMWSDARQCECLEWSLTDLLATVNDRDMEQRARRRGLSRGREREVLFRVEAWTFCRFLWFSGEGKYRPKLMEYLRRELRGDSGPEVFKDVFGCRGLEGFGGAFPAMEAEWKAYVDELLKAVEDD